MIKKSLQALLLALVTLAILPAANVVGAQIPQQIPTPAQAQAMLQANPSLIGRLQQMLATSGMSQEQVKDRLRAAGYPDSLLDRYFRGAENPADSTALPDPAVFGAFRALGLADSSLVDSLGAVVSTRRKAKATDNASFMDSVQKALQNDTTREAIRQILRSRDVQRAALDSGFQVFGAGLFQGEAAVFAANATAGGADPNYRFGPGDRLVVGLTGDTEKAWQVQVSREGTIVIPSLGPVAVSGMTRAALEDMLYTRLSRFYSRLSRNPGATTRLYLNVNQLGQNQVSVTGDVTTPKSYRVSRAATVMDVLYLAGGPTPNGSMRSIQVRRNLQTIATLDVYDLALRADARDDIRLESGDIVFVPPRGPQVRVAGAVLRPAIYEIKEGQTLSQLVAVAGGFTETANRRRVQIDRVVPPAERTTAGADRKTINVETDLFDSAPIRGGDVILVSQIASRVSSRVAVVGNVWAEGPMGFTPGMRLSEALRRAGGLKPDSYLGEVLISRLRPDSTREALRTAVYDTTGRPVDDLVLSDADEIRVFSSTAMRPLMYVTISGAVRKSGRIPFRAGMTLRDAVLSADGLTEGASLDEAEVARLPESRAAGVTAMTYPVRLDSTYLGGQGVGSRAFAVGGAASGGREPEFVLQPYDAVLIKRQPDFQLHRMVSVRGQVKSPGEYSLRSSNEKLSDIIKRAGGLTNTGYAGGIVFFRRDVGRIGIDLPRVLQDPGFVDDLQLADGDSIFIPAYAPVVLVRGAVNALATPSFGPMSTIGVAYVPGADIDYYVRSAGGESIKGDAGRAFVTQPNGKVESRHGHLFWTSKPQPNAGSTVIVPVKDPSTAHDWVQIATATGGLLGSLLAVIVVLKR